MRKWVVALKTLDEKMNPFWFLTVLEVMSSVSAVTALTLHIGVSPATEPSPPLPFMLCQPLRADGS